MSRLIEGLLIDNFQIVLFFSPDTTFKSLNVANKISEVFGDLFTDDPNIITLPPNAPVEIPRLIYNQGDITQFAIGFSRADFTIKMKKEDDWESKIKAFSIKLKKLFIEILNIRIIRIGLVTNFTFNDNFTIDSFTKQYINSDKLNDLAEYNMSWLKKIKIKDINANKWIRLFISEHPQEKRILIIDINTIFEQSLDFNNIELDEIIDTFLDCFRGDIEDVI